MTTFKGTYGRFLVGGRTMVHLLAGMIILASVWFVSQSAVSGALPNVEYFRSVIAGLGAFGPIASVALMILHGLLPIPVELLSAVNGVVFGLWGGTALTWLGMMLAAMIGYGAARASSILASRALPYGRLQKASEWVESGGWWKLLLARQMPFISFWAMNLALGALKVPFLRFTWTTALGNIPYALGITFLSTSVT